jgi:hypothetical protein
LNVKEMAQGSGGHPAAIRKPMTDLVRNLIGFIARD